MKKTSSLMLGSLLLTLGASLSVQADQRFRDTARVIEAVPLYETIEVQNPERYCWDEDVSYLEPAQENYAGTMLGGIVGGVMANQIYRGRGRGRDAATLAGALLGGAIGHDLTHASQRQRLTTRTEQHCEVENHISYEERVVGYRVKYRYKGHVFTTRTREYPGERIPVRVGVVPSERI